MSLASMLSSGSYIDPNASQDMGWAALNGDSGDPTSDAQAQQILTAARNRGVPIQELPAGGAIPAGYIGVGSFGGKQYVMSNSGYQNFQQQSTAQERAKDESVLQSMKGGLGIMTLPLGVNALQSAIPQLAAANPGWGAGANAALAGGGEVGSGYAASAPGLGGAIGGVPALPEGLGGGLDIPSGGGELVGGGSGSGAGGGAGGGEFIGGATGGEGAIGGGTAVGADGLPAGLGGVATTGAVAGAAGGAAGTAASTALSRILSGNGTAADYATLAGQVAPGLIGAYASGQQADAIKALADRARTDRLPFLEKATGYLNDPSSYINGPGQTSMNSVLRALSVNGNPANNPTSMGLAAEAGLRDWRSAVTGFGNLGLSGENTQAQLGLAGVNADANVWNSLGAGVSNAVNPPKSLADILASFKSSGSPSLV